MNNISDQAQAPVPFSEWCAAVHKEQEETDNTIGTLFLKSFEDTKEQDKEKLEAEIKKAQEEVADQIRKDYERRGSVDTPETEKGKAALASMVEDIHRKIEKDQAAYNRRYSFGNPL